MKGQKNKILTIQESRADVFYFLRIANFLKQLLFHNTQIDVVIQANAETKALSKNVFLTSHIK